MSRMSLLLKVNVALGAAFLAAALLLVLWYRFVLQTYATQELQSRAALMLDSAVAMRTYTADEIVPLLAERMQREFLPQDVPFYAATQNFMALRRRYPQYSYREATLNPTNPRDHATDWEADIIQRFRNDPKVQRISGVRETPMGRQFYLAEPIRADRECLGCHGLAAQAPPTLIARYGANNGFGWQPKEVVGAQVVTVPVGSATVHAAGLFSRILGAALAAFALLWAAVNAIVYLLVVRPVRELAGAVDRLSLGQGDADALATHGPEEIAAIGRSFERMRTSLEKAMRMLSE